MKKTDDRPIHLRIAADIRAAVMSCDLPQGTKLPSTKQLCEQYGAANTTVQKALQVLKAEGLLVSRMGAGVYVWDRVQFVVEAGVYFNPTPGGYTYRVLDVAEVRPPADVVEALGLVGGGTAIMRKRLMLHDSEPVELSRSYYPTEIAAGTPLAGRGKIKGGAPAVLTSLGHPPQGDFEDLVSARPPTSEEYVLLDLPGEVPVIRTLRTIYSGKDRPVEVTEMIKGGHLYVEKYRQPVR